MKKYQIFKGQNQWMHKSITFLDYSRILNCIQNDLGKSSVSATILHYLYLLISASKKYNSDKIPDYVITMNSDVILQFDNNQQQRIKIVYPGNIKDPYHKSIYSPVGAACFGATEKSFVYFEDEYGYNRAYIKKLVFQPEKEELYYL
jgi:hypothetical protein